MTGSKFDILIVAHEKDFEKLQFLIPSIERNIQGYNEIHIISNIELPTKLKQSNINYHLDRRVLRLDFRRNAKGNISKRFGWYKQQFIKLFQNVTLPEYFVIDSDVYLHKPLDVYTNGKPNFFFGKDQCHQPYFDFTTLYFGFSRLYPYSFINEMMLFKRDVVNELFGEDYKSFFNGCIDILNKINHPTSSFSEYETYGNFIYWKYPETYNYKYLTTQSIGKRGLFTKEEIQSYINKTTNYHKISFHSWM